jgi:6-phosphogluconolactonase
MTIRKSGTTLTRRGFLRATCAGALGSTLAGGAFMETSARARELLVYVGTYTSGGGEGIYLYRLDLADGSLRHVSTTAGVPEPSYLTLAPDGRFLYSVNEVEEFEGARGGAVSAFAVERKTGTLRFVNRRASRGGAPCYLTASASGRFVLVANYSGGNVAVLPALGGGGLGEAVDVRQFAGSGPNRERQEGPHAHCVVLDPADRFAYACDLGTDRVMSYRFDRGTGRLTPNTQPWFAARPGAGPRHLTFHPNGRFVYVLNELDSTVTALAFDRAGGALRELQTLSALPAGFAGANTGADIHVAPGGRFLYCSNRGHDSIALFGLDTRTGGLTPLGHTPTRGSTPRNFAIDPAGRYLLVANQKSDSVVTFRLDPRTGAPEPTGQTARVPAPVCLKLAAPFS